MSGLKDMLLGDQPFHGYPQSPGFKENGTSREAAHRMTPSATALRGLILSELMHWQTGLTADELASHLGHSILAVRPRVSELNKQGKIKKTSERRKNASGMSAAVWVLA
jgi:FaeA-like protein